MNRTHLPALFALLALASLGCTAGRQNDALTRDLPYASRVEVLDAEYQLTLANDELRSADDAVRAAQEELSRAEHGLDQAQAAPKEVDAAKARLEFLRANDALAKEKLRLAKAQASCAKLQYERDRLRILEREQVADAKRVPAEPVQQKLEQCELSADGVAAEKESVEKRARAARANWERAEAVLSLEKPAPADAPYLD